MYLDFSNYIVVALMGAFLFFILGMLYVVFKAFSLAPPETTKRLRGPQFLIAYTVFWTFSRMLVDNEIVVFTSESLALTLTSITTLTYLILGWYVLHNVLNPKGSESEQIENSKSKLAEDYEKNKQKLTKDLLNKSKNKL